MNLAHSTVGPFMGYTKKDAPFFQFTPSNSEQELWEGKVGSSCHGRASREWQASKRCRSLSISEGWHFLGCEVSHLARSSSSAPDGQSTGLS
jgi:hypothetical protein